MDSRTLIELLAMLIAIVGVSITLYKMNISLHQKTSENTIRIMGIEKEIIQMKETHEKDLTELKLYVAETFREIKKENREDHGKIFSKLESVAIRLEGVSASFEAYLTKEKVNK